MTSKCFNISLNKNKFWYASAGAVLLTIGLLQADHRLDSASAATKGQTSYTGTVFFVLGWLLIAFAVSLDADGVYSVEYATKRGLAAIGVLIAAVWAQNQVIKGGTRAIMMGLIPFMIMWGIFIGMVIWTSDAYSQEILIKGIVGTLLIIASMMVLFTKRRYNFMTGGFDGPSDVYNIGLPMFVLGWVLVVLTISECA